MASQITVVERDDQEKQRLVGQLGASTIAVSSLQELARELTGQSQVVVLGPSQADMENLIDAGLLINAHPEIRVILVAGELPTPLFRQTMRAGILDVVPNTVGTVALLEAIDRAKERGQDDLTIPPPPPENDRPPPPADEWEPDTGFMVPSEVDEDGEDGEGKQGRIITIFSTKGGAGKSMLASNFAVALARRSKRPVVLVDGDLQFGDIAIMLQMAPTVTMVDAVTAVERRDYDLLQSLLLQHSRSGVYVLPAPTEPQFAEQIPPSQVLAVLSMLREIAAFVVVDTPANFSESVLGILDQSDDILMIAGLDIPNIKNVKIGLQTLRLLNTNMSKLSLVLNRANSKVQLDVGEVEKTLQIKALAQIPSDVLVPLSVNKGMPVVLEAPNSDVAQAIDKLAAHFLPSSQPARRRRRWW